MWLGRLRPEVRRAGGSGNSQTHGLSPAQSAEQKGDFQSSRCLCGQGQNQVKREGEVTQGTDGDGAGREEDSG